MDGIYTRDPLSWVLWVACASVAVFCLVPSKRTSSNLKWASPKIAFGVAFLLLHVIRPLYLMLTGDYYGTRLGFYQFESSRELNLMLIASLVGALAFLLGWHTAMHRKPRKTKLGASYRVEDNRKLNIIRIVFLFPFAILACYWGLRGNMLPEQINIYYFLRSSLFAIVYLFTISAIETKYKVRRLSYLASALLVTGLFLWLFAEEGGASRLFLLLFIVPGFVVIAFFFRRRTFGIILLASTVTLAALMIIGNIRTSAISRDSSGVLPSWREAGDPVFYILRGGDFEAFEKGMLIMGLVPSYEAPFWGRSFATLFIMPIPRMLWPGKPLVSMTSPIIAWNPLVPENFAVTLVAEAYANWLWPGIFISLYIFGFISSHVYKGALGKPQDIELWILIGLYMAYVLLVMRGSFHTMTSYFLFCLFWFVVSRFIVRIFRRTGRVFVPLGRIRG